MSADAGSISVDHRSNDLTWAVNRLPRDKSPELQGTVYLAPGAPQPLESIYATLSYNVPGALRAGCRIVFGLTRPFLSSTSRLY